MNHTIKVLGFAGSLRSGSYNRSLLRAVPALLPPGMELEAFDLAPIPVFNADLEKNMPGPVVDFKKKVRAADAILIVTPEYNYSIPGVLKNAIDWASRPHGDNSWEGKPVALMSSSTGMLGGARAQYHLRQTFVFLNMFAVNRPEVIVTFAADKFDTDGRLTDEKAENLITQLMTALADLTGRLTIRAV
jgi:chromate reductase